MRQSTAASASPGSRQVRADRGLAPVMVPVLVSVLVLVFALSLAPALDSGGCTAGAAETTNPDLPVITAIEIEGNDHTDDAVVYRVMELQVGDSFDEDRFDSIWDRVEDCGYFSFVEMDFDETEPGEVTLFVQVEEEKTLHLGPYLRYSRRWNFLVGVHVWDRNLRGKGETVDLLATFAHVLRFRAGFERPWFLNEKSLSTGLGGGWETANFVFRPTDYSWWDVNGWLRWTFLGPVFLQGDLMYGGFDQQESFSWPAPDRGEGSPGTKEWPARWRYRLVPAATLGLDTRDSSFYPMRGGWHRLEIRDVEGQDFPSFLAYSADLRHFIPTPWGQTVGLRAYGRLVSDPVPFEDYLYWGGVDDIRGYPYASIEGEEGFQLSCEVRWPFFLMPLAADGQVFGLGVHAFVDAGDAWFKGAGSGETKVGYGGGLHLCLASYQLRFEFAATRDGDTSFAFQDHFSF